MARPGTDHDGFLPLATAAARLGVSRLKLREAIARGLIPARRDNEGRWRADLSAAPADLGAAPPAQPAALIEALFDEIEELTAERDDAEAGAARLAALVAAQDAALARAMAAIEANEAALDRLGRTADAALTAAETATARAEALQVAADRAVMLAERAAQTASAEAVARERDAAELAEKTRALDGQARLLDRLFSLSETALETAGRAAARDGAGRGLWDRVLRRK